LEGKMKDRRSFFPAWTVLLFSILLLSSPLLAGCGGEEEAPASLGEEGWLLIQGSGVEEPVRLSLEELKAMEEGLVEDDYFSINSYGTEQYFHFRGIWVWHLLQEKVKLKEGASKVTFIAGDGYQVEYTLEEVQREDYIDQRNPAAKYKMILAWEEDGWENSAREPFRLVVGQREPGEANKPYWVRNVRIIRID
jgi:DMSO/TMAO reductase YedYZ molybdopterin-dependent catalytic subunit